MNSLAYLLVCALFLVNLVATKKESDDSIGVTRDKFPLDYDKKFGDYRWKNNKLCWVINDNDDLRRTPDFFHMTHSAYARQHQWRKSYPTKLPGYNKHRIIYNPENINYLEPILRQAASLKKLFFDFTNQNLDLRSLSEWEKSQFDKHGKILSFAGLSFDDFVKALRIGRCAFSGIHVTDRCSFTDSNVNKDTDIYNNSPSIQRKKYLVKYACEGIPLGAAEIESLKGFFIIPTFTSVLGIPQKTSKGEKWLVNPVYQDYLFHSTMKMRFCPAGTSAYTGELTQTVFNDILDMDFLKPFVKLFNIDTADFLEDIKNKVREMVCANEAHIKLTVDREGRVSMTGSQKEERKIFSRDLRVGHMLSTLHSVATGNLRDAMNNAINGAKEEICKVLKVVHWLPFSSWIEKITKCEELKDKDADIEMKLRTNTNFRITSYNYFEVNVNIYAKVYVEKFVTDIIGKGFLGRLKDWTKVGYLRFSYKPSRESIYVKVTAGGKNLGNHAIKIPIPKSPNLGRCLGKEYSLRTGCASASTLRLKK